MDVIFPDYRRILKTVWSQHQARLRTLYGDSQRFVSEFRSLMVDAFGDADAAYEERYLKSLFAIAVEEHVNLFKLFESGAAVSDINIVKYNLSKGTHSPQAVAWAMKMALCTVSDAQESILVEIETASVLTTAEDNHTIVRVDGKQFLWDDLAESVNKKYDYFLSHVNSLFRIVKKQLKSTEKEEFVALYHSLNRDNQKLFACMLYMPNVNKYKGELIYYRTDSIIYGEKKELTIAPEEGLPLAEAASFLLCLSAETKQQMVEFHELLMNAYFERTGTVCEDSEFMRIQLANLKIKF